MLPRLLLTTALLASVAGCSATDSDEPGDAFACPGTFPESSTSAYVLPYAPGQSVIVGQGTCTDGSHSEDQAFAYDFDMPTGTVVVSARAGHVIDVEAQFRNDNGTSGEENFVVVEHDDGTVAGYYHLTQDGAEVEVGDRVAQQGAIGRSGNTGDSSEPHLHFEVLDAPDGDTLPVTFSNTRSHPNGLQEGQSYTADSDA